MTPRYFKFAFLLVAVVASFIFLTSIFDGKPDRVHPLKFIDEQNFYVSIDKVEKMNLSFPAKIGGGITPHHLYAGEMIADFYSKLSKQNLKTIVLIGPNHKEAGKFKVITSKMGWETPFGVVSTNEELADKLIDNSLIGLDEAVIEDDHSVAGSMSFIKYFLPDTPVVTLILSAYMTLDEIDNLSKKLSQYTTGDTVFVASVDFSHYLRSEKASENDQKTLTMMKERDYKSLSIANSDYLDSPSSIITLLKVMDAKKFSKLEVLSNTNSGQMQNDETVETTSYFSIIFY